MAEEDLELTARALEGSRDFLRGFQAFVHRYLGSTPEEIRETLDAVDALTPAQIREGLLIYKAYHPSELAEIREIVGRGEG